MNSLIPFDFNSKTVNIVNRDGKPWWVAKDVCEALGLKDVNRILFGHKERKGYNEGLDSDEIAETYIVRVSSNGVEQKRKSYIINEPGLYRLIFKSRTKAADKFKRWVFHEVLPHIRKKGFYRTTQMRLGYDWSRNNNLPVLFMNQSVETSKEYNIQIGKKLSIPLVKARCDLYEGLFKNRRFKKNDATFPQLVDLKVAEETCINDLHYIDFNDTVEEEIFNFEEGRYIKALKDKDFLRAKDAIGCILEMKARTKEERPFHYDFSGPLLR